MKTVEELKQERLMIAARALVRIKQVIEETTVQISQLDGAIAATEQHQQDVSLSSNIG